MKKKVSRELKEIKAAIELWAVYQAEKLGERGIGLKSVSYEGGIPTIFTQKTDARNWLAKLIKQIKYEQSIGVRSKDNLNKKKKLDFYIAKVLLIPSKESYKAMKKRGWNFKASDKFRISKQNVVKTEKQRRKVSRDHEEEVSKVGWWRKFLGWKNRVLNT